MIEWCIAGCRVRLSCLFFATAALLLTVDQSGVAAAGLAASLLHETGHLVTMLFLGCHPSAVCLGVFGMRVEYPQSIRVSYLRSAVISLAGPAVNLLMAGLLFHKGATMHACVQLTLGSFNLLPIEALDGGQALRCLLLRRIRPERAGRMVTVSSVVCLAAVALTGLLVLLSTRYNFTLLLFALYLTFLLIFKKKD